MISVNMNGSGISVNVMSLSGKQSLNNRGLKGISLVGVGSQTDILYSVGIKTRIIDSIMIPFMSQDWRTIEENMFLFDLFREEIDLIILRNPQADICVYKDLLSIVELAFEQYQEITCLEKKIYEGRDDVTTMVVKLGSMRLKPELELYNLILGEPDYKKGEKHSEIIVEEVAALMKKPRATFANISKYLKHKYGYGF